MEKQDFLKIAKMYVLAADEFFEDEFKKIQVLAEKALEEVLSNLNFSVDLERQIKNGHINPDKIKANMPKEVIINGDEFTPKSVISFLKLLTNIKKGDWMDNYKIAEIDPLFFINCRELDYKLTNFMLDKVILQPTVSIEEIEGLEEIEETEE